MSPKTVSVKWKAEATIHSTPPTQETTQSCNDCGGQNNEVIDDLTTEDGLSVKDNFEEIEKDNELTSGFILDKLTIDFAC